MSTTIDLDKPLGHVAIYNPHAGIFQAGYLYQCVTPATKKRPEKISYEITDPKDPIFTWGSGDTLQDVVNSFLTNSHENERVALIEPEIYNMVIRERIAVQSKKKV